MLGGDSGDAIIPGDAAASPLIKAVRYEDAAFQMPPNPQISYGGVGTNITANFCGRFIDSPPLFPL